jgi:hypothetical protein
MYNVQFSKEVPGTNFSKFQFSLLGVEHFHNKHTKKVSIPPAANLQLHLLLYT